ncbi:hypothetical protein BP6252_04650 [Coleophoma cylindrospora]|uniref:Uncharacterized protein n=1 Tax=Coleophoma cylindrospora TaxID=1849047 RepID=A0A3D8S125_9HELO|nr:hypothetical protein BP6252_04650 [Coleophoma cylindrospora]
MARNPNFGGLFATGGFYLSEDYAGFLGALTSQTRVASGYTYASTANSSTEAVNMTEPYTREAIRARMKEICKEVGKIQRLFEDATQDDVENGDENGFRLNIEIMNQCYMHSARLLSKPEVPYEIKAMLHFYMAYGHYDDEVALSHLQKSLDALDSLDKIGNRNLEFTKQWRELTMHQIEYHSIPDTSDLLPEDLETPGFVQFLPTKKHKQAQNGTASDQDLQTLNTAQDEQAQQTCGGSDSTVQAEPAREEEAMLLEDVAALSIGGKGEEEDLVSIGH